MEQATPSPPAVPVPLPQDGAPSRWSQLRDWGRQARGRGASPELAAALLGIATAGVALGWWVAAGPLGDAARLTRLIALPGLSALAWVVGVGGLLATATLVETRAPGVSRRAALQIAALPWFPCLACIPVVLSIIQSGRTAYDLLFSPPTAQHFGLYLLVWCVLLEIGVLIGAMLAGRPGTVSALDVPPPKESMSPPVRLPPVWVAIVLAVSLTVLFNWGILEQFSMTQGEFLSHRHAASIMLHEDLLPYDLERPVWQRINVPPSTFVLFWGPWTLLPDQVGLYVHFFAHYAAFLAAAVLLLRGHVPGLRPLELGLVLLFLVSLFAPWRETIWLGQPNGFILLLVVLGLRWFLAGRTWPLAAAIAVALTLKPTTTWLLVYFLVRRSLRILVAIGVVGLGTIVVSAAIGGIEPWRVWLMEQALLLLRGAALFTSIGLPSLHARLFLSSHAYASPAPMTYLPLAQALNYVALVGGAWLLLRLVQRDRPDSDRIGKTLEFGLALTLSLTLSPLTWLHYATTALVGLTALLHPAVRAALPRPARASIMALGAFAFATLCIDPELLAARTGKWWVDFPLIGSVNNLGPLVLVATLALVIWLYNRHRDRLARLPNAPPASPSAERGSQGRNEVA